MQIGGGGMRALVTGAAGFVGSRLCQQLRRDGFDVIGADCFTDYYDPELKRRNAEAIEKVGVDVRNVDLNDCDLQALLHDVEVIFHLAGQPGVRASWGAEFRTYTACNVEATQRLLEASRCSSRLQRIVYASSSSVYGNAERYPTRELDRPQPLSPYGVTKLAAEHLCSLYATSYGIPTVSLRYFTVYGPGQRPDMAFTRFAYSALQGKEILIYGSGAQIRDFSYVDDVVVANVLASTHPNVVPGTVLNVAGGSHTSVNEVLQLFQELAGSKLDVRYVDPVAGDVQRTGGDTSAIRELLGWQPKVELKDGVREQFEWARQVLG